MYSRHTSACTVLVNSVYTHSEEPRDEEECEATIGSLAVSVVSGDLVCEKTDAILNPADVNLSLGGLVSRKILIEGGFSIQVECDTLKSMQLARNFQH